MTDAAAQLLPLMSSPLAMTTGPIDAFYQNFVNVLDGAYGEVYQPLLYLWRFFIVVTISWMGLQWALTENPVAAQGLRRLIFLSAILFVAHEWVPITESIAGGFSQLGVLAAGADGYDVTEVRRPSSFGTHSFTTAFVVIDKATALASGWRSTLSNLPVIVLLLLAGLGIFACGAIIVLLMLTYLLLFKVGCVVVFCLLPFGAFDKTAWVVNRPLGWVMSNGIRFLVLTLVVGLLYRFAADATNQALDVDGGTWTDLGNATAVSLQLLLVNLLLLVFVLMANRFAGEIAGGAASLGLGDFTNRIASAGTAEPIVRSVAGAATSAGKYAAGGTALGLVAAGAGVVAAGAVWSKARQKLGGTASSSAAPSAGGATGSAAATAAQPITSLMRPTPAAVRRMPRQDGGGPGIWVEILDPQPRPRSQTTPARLDHAPRRALPS